MNGDLNSRLVENRNKLNKQKNDLNDIIKLTENTNENLQDGQENLVGQRNKIQMGIDKVAYLFEFGPLRSQKNPE